MNDNWNSAIIFLSLHKDKTGGEKNLIDFKEGLEPYVETRISYISLAHLFLPLNHAVFDLGSLILLVFSIVVLKNQNSL